MIRLYRPVNRVQLIKESKVDAEEESNNNEDDVRMTTKTIMITMTNDNDRNWHQFGPFQEDQKQLVSYLIGVLSQVNHKGLYQGWRRLSERDI